MESKFHVYCNDGNAGPIDYTSPIATVTGDQWSGPPLRPSGAYRFGIRAFDSMSGREERNVDGVIELILDADGNDVTRLPLPPVGLRALPVAGSGLRLEWARPVVDRTRRPKGFHVYAGIGPGLDRSVDYTTPVATVLWSSGTSGWFSTQLTGLRGGTSYVIGVRSFNESGEETNMRSVVALADATPPSMVDFLGAFATAEGA